MKYKPEKIDAVLAIKNDAIVSQKADGSIEFIDKNPTNITDKQIDDKLVELNQEYINTEFQRNRAVAYPSIGDQLDMIMKDMRDGTKTHQEACEAVKSKYPKE